jgi:hypothetical protein
LSQLVPTSWELRGYVEDTFNIEYREAGDRVFPLNGARVRVNLEGRPNHHFDFGAGVVGTLFSGRTSVGLAQYLPAGDRAALFAGDPSSGLPPASDLLVYQLDNAIYLQEAFATVHLPWARLRVGRHKIYAGTGFAYNPTDLFTRKDPLDPTYEVDGLDALALAVELPARTTLEGLALIGDRFDVSDYRVAAKSHLGGWDLALHYTHQVRRRTDWQALASAAGVVAVIAGGPSSLFERRFRWHLLAAELAGEILGVGVYAEGGWTWVDPIDDPGTVRSQDHERFLVGADYTFAFQLYVMVEYMRLGQGRDSAAAIDLNDRLGFFAGELLAIDRDTLFAGASYPITDLVELAFYAMVGINDPSAVLNPWLLVDLYPGVRVAVSGMVPVGSEQGSNGRSGAGGFARVRVSF